MKSKVKKKVKKSLTKNCNEDLSLERIISLGGSAEDLNLINTVNGNLKTKLSSNNIKVSFYYLLVACLSFIYLFIYHNIYHPDSQESNKGAIIRASNYSNLLLEMPRYCYLVEFFFNNFIKM